MQRVVIDEPYVPVLPHRGRFWPAVLAPVVPLILRKSYGVTRVECVHGERLRESVRAGHGVMLTPNHCRDEDPLVLGALAKAGGSPLFIIASWHVFKASRLNGFLLAARGGVPAFTARAPTGARSTPPSRCWPTRSVRW